MYALLIKPAAMKSKSNRDFIFQLKANGAAVLTQHEPKKIRTELEKFISQNESITVLACGGDGTVNLAINSLIDLPVNFGVVPMGTGNDFARHIGIKNLQQAQTLIEEHQIVNVDLGKITFADSSFKYFVAVASCGFDAEVNERANKLSGPNGPVKYLAAVLGELKDLSSRQLKLTFNGSCHENNLTLVAVGNTSSYGGGMKITPSADLRDGLFSITIVNQTTRRTLLRVLPKVFSGSHVFHPKVSIEQTNCIEISGDPFPIYADGERMGIGPAKFEIVPARLRLLVPNTK